MSKYKPPPKNSLIQRLKAKFLHQPVRSDSAFLQAVKEAEEHHVISHHLRLIIEGAIEVENITVGDVMVPKAKMVMIKNDTSTADLIKIMTNSTHSRFPIFDSKNKVLGIILAKDLLRFLAENKSVQFGYKDHLRDAILVPESKTLDFLLQEFQQKKSHMAIVMDEYGETTGLITLEDILEQIVGEIEDEHDFEKDNIIELSEGRFLLKSEISLDEFNEFFEVDLSAENIDTIGGFVVHGFTRLPEQGSTIELQGFDFKVLKADSRRIHLLEAGMQKSTPQAAK